MGGIWHMCKSAQNRPSSQPEWPKETSEGGHQDTYDYSEEVKSFSSWDSAYNNCYMGSSPVKALWESGKEKTIESSFNLH